jgi:hypothetical protein
MTTLLDQVVRGHRQTIVRHRNTHHREWPGPILLTETQARQIHAEAYIGPRDVDALDELIEAARRGGARMFHLPVQLVDTQPESTPYLEGWI